MITKISESKTLTKHISSKCKYCHSNQKWNNNKRCCECKNKKNMCAKKIFRILLDVVVKIVNI